MIIDRPSLIAVLNGDQTGLIGAFCWRDSPQGHRHWAWRWQEEAVLTEQDIEWLHDLLRKETEA